MLALASISTATRCLGASPGSSSAACRRKGRANAKASSPRAAARNNSRSQLSSRFRFVSRGGVGARNISELNGTSPRGARRIRWNTIGAAIARAPRT
jgi:hypothetical protein